MWPHQQSSSIDEFAAVDISCGSRGRSAYMLHISHSTSSYGRRQCADRCQFSHRLVCSSSHSLGVISGPPQFDVPERQPTPDEASSIAAGSKLTPQQQLAQQLQLPITQPVHLPPGAPSPRQLMQRIKAAKTWQELEAAVYQKQELLALQQGTQLQQQQQQPPPQQGGLEPPSAQPLQQGWPVGPPTTPSQAEQQQQQPQQDPQQPQPPVQQPQPLVQAARKQRRKQPVPLLNVTSTSLQLGLSGSADVAQPTPAVTPTQPPTGNSSRSPPTEPPSNSQQQQSWAAPTAQQPQVLTIQQQEYRQQPLLNALHVCEAFLKLPALLPQQQGQLSPSERQRVAQLLTHLCQVALQHASDLSFDTRGLAHVLAGLSKLGHRDETLLAELQLAALLAVQDFSSRHAAMLLAAFATMGVRPQAELLQALQEHISSTLGLFEGQSLSTTIWALAKLQDMAAVQAKLSPQPSTPDQGTAGGTLSSRSQSAAAFTAAGTAAAGAGGEVVPVVPQQLVQSLLWRCNPQMHHWSGRDIAQAAWGLAKLGARPNATWRLALLAAAEPKLGKMNVQDLANLLSALPTLRALPEPSWLDTLCSVAATKMWLASSLGVYNLLMGLLRLKQVQHKAAKTAAKRQQQQLLQEQSTQEQEQEQQQQVGRQAGFPGDNQEQDAAKQQQAQDISPGAAGLEHDEAHRGVEAASQELPTGDNQSPHAHTAAAGGDAVGASASPAAVAAASPCAGTLAELRLLKVAAQWLQAHPKALQRWQLSGVICAFGELLPDAKPAQGEQHVQSTSPGPRVATSTQHKQHGALHKGDTSSACVQGSQRRAWERARGALVEVLQQMVPAWAEEIEGMAKGMGKGRKARYFQLKWAELLSKCGQALPE